MNFFRNAPKRFGRITASGQYTPQIDGLRFLAIAPVLLWHSGLRGFRLLTDPTTADSAAMAWLPHGHVGVDLFFFISGFIIAYPFLIGRAPTAAKFFKRRLLRLEPPYILVMLGCFALLSFSGLKPTASPSFYRTEAPLWQSLVASIFYMHGLIFNAPPRLNPPAWSLEIEIQFYILSPVILWLYTRATAGAGRRAVLFGAAVLSLLGGQLLLQTFGYESALRWTLLTHAYPFLLGILVCDWSQEHRPFEQKTTPWADLGLLAGVVMLLVSGVVEETRRLDLALIKDVARAGAIILIFWGASMGSHGRKILGNGWLALIGGACYSIYLVHVPVMQAVAEILHRVWTPSSLMVAMPVAFVVMGLAGVVAGLIFYVLIERPCTLPDWPSKLVARLRGRGASQTQPGE
jgi:peptidoglycan/LPS O-acetylase OafA/YrhL